MWDLLFLMKTLMSGDKRDIRDKKHEQHLSFWRAVLATPMVSERSRLLNARGKGLDYIYLVRQLILYAAWLKRALTQVVEKYGQICFACPKIWSCRDVFFSWSPRHSAEWLGEVDTSCLITICSQPSFSTCKQFNLLPFQRKWTPSFSAGII